MGMSHANCSHDRTPAGRAACRRRQQLGSPTGRLNVERAPVFQQVPMPPDDVKTDDGVRNHQRAEKTRQRGSQAVLTYDDHAPTTDRYRRGRHFIRTEGDLAFFAVPHAFSAVIRHAWKQGWEVKVTDPYNDNEKRIRIRNGLGDATMVWRPATPHGINAMMWRKVNTAITEKVSTANILISCLEGKVQ